MSSKDKHKGENLRHNGCLSTLREFSVAVVPDGLGHLLLLVDQRLLALHDLLQVRHFHLESKNALVGLEKGISHDLFATL